MHDAATAALASERAENEHFRAENRVLRERIRLLHLTKYGPKSEQLGHRQLQLL